MAFCENCGFKMNEGAKFCAKCGTAALVIPSESIPVAQAAPSAPVQPATAAPSAQTAPVASVPPQAPPAPEQTAVNTPPAASSPPLKGPPPVPPKFVAQKASPAMPKPAPDAPKASPPDAGYVLSLPKGVIKITQEMVKLPANFKGTIVIPEGIQVIDDECFKDRAITGVTFPQSLKEIGAWAFHGCQLTELTLQGTSAEEKLKVENCAFVDNLGLRALTLGNCVLDYLPFSNCPVTRITITGEIGLADDDDYELLGLKVAGGAPQLFQIAGSENVYNADTFCSYLDDSFISTFSSVYGRANGTYVLKEKLVRTCFPARQINTLIYNNGSYIIGPRVGEGCADCTLGPCFTLAGCEKGEGRPDPHWEMI